MIRAPFEGAWYGDCAIGGAWAVLMPSVPEPYIRTSQGNVPLPPGGNLLYLVMALVNGRLCLAGQGHSDGLAWLWNGHDWKAVAQAYGTSPCLYGPHGCYVSVPAASNNNIQAFDALTFEPTVMITKPIGVRGIAAITGAGLIASDVHGIDAWYGQHGLAEFIDVGGLFIGQGSGGGCHAAGYGELEPGDVQFIRVHRDGDNLAVAMWKPLEKQAVVLWLTVVELNDLPKPPVDPPPVDPPPPPPEPPPMALIAPNRMNAVELAMRDHPEINPRDEAQRGKLLDYAAAALGGRPWGRKSRNPQGTDLNTDGLTFLRPDGLFEIYDVISGVDGSATWEGYGPFSQGQNGYWVPALPVSDQPPPDDDPPPTDDLRQLIAALTENMEAFRQAAQSKINELDGKAIVAESRLKALEEKQPPVVTLPKGRAYGKTSAAGGGWWGRSHTHDIDIPVVRE